MARSRSLIGLCLFGGKAQTRVVQETLHGQLMEGFGNPTNMGLRNLKNSFKDAMELAQARLKSYARSENSGSKILAQNLETPTP